MVSISNYIVLFKIGQNGACESYIKSEPTDSNNQDVNSCQNQRFSTEESNQTNARKSTRNIHSSDNPMFELPPSLKVEHEAKPDMSIVDESEKSSEQLTQMNTNNGASILGNSMKFEFS